MHLVEPPIADEPTSNESLSSKGKRLREALFRGSATLLLGEAAPLAADIMDKYTIDSHQCEQNDSSPLTATQKKDIDNYFLSLLENAVIVKESDFTSKVPITKDICESIDALSNAAETKFLETPALRNDGGRTLHGVLPNHWVPTAPIVSAATQMEMANQRVPPALLRMFKWACEGSLNARRKKPSEARINIKVEKLGELHKTVLEHAYKRVMLNQEKEEAKQNKFNFNESGYNPLQTQTASPLLIEEENGFWYGHPDSHDIQASYVRVPKISEWVTALKSRKKDERLGSFAGITSALGGQSMPGMRGVEYRNTENINLIGTVVIHQFHENRTFNPYEKANKQPKNDTLEVQYNSHPRTVICVYLPPPVLVQKMGGISGLSGNVFQQLMSPSGTTRANYLKLLYLTAQNLYKTITEWNQNCNKETTIKCLDSNYLLLNMRGRDSIYVENLSVDDLPLLNNARIEENILEQADVEKMLKRLRDEHQRDTDKYAELKKLQKYFARVMPVKQSSEENPVKKKEEESHSRRAKQTNRRRAPKRKPDKPEKPKLDDDAARLPLQPIQAICYSQVGFNEKTLQRTCIKTDGAKGPDTKPDNLVTLVNDFRIAWACGLDQAAMMTGVGIYLPHFEFYTKGCLVAARPTATTEKFRMQSNFAYEKPEDYDARTHMGCQLFYVRNGGISEIHEIFKRLQARNVNNEDEEDEEQNKELYKNKSKLANVFQPRPRDYKELIENFDQNVLQSSLTL